MTRRFLFNAYPTNAQGGGAVVKIDKIRAYLTARGHTVDLFDPWRSRIEAYDVYHHFSMFPADLPMVRFAKAAGAKLCVETMYWASWRHAVGGGGPPAARALRLARYAQRRIAPRTTRERAILSLADSVMVNSEIEASLVARDFGISPEKIAVCYNGVDARFADATPDLFEARFNIRDFVLVTGMFEARKNQLGLIRAMAGLDIPLVLIGPTPAVHRPYLEACRAAAGSNVHFIEALEHDDPVFRSAYAACRVLALPSWHETTGKSALEAGLLGKNVMMTTHAPAAREYFGDLISYINPADRDAMRAAVRRLMDAPPATALARRIQNHFTWETVLAAREARYLGLTGDHAATAP